SYVYSCCPCRPTTVSFLNDTATTKTYTLSYTTLFRSIVIGEDLCVFCEMLISDPRYPAQLVTKTGKAYKFDSIECMIAFVLEGEDRKSTRLNSSHVKISYAVFCLKKKKTNTR